MGMFPNKSCSSSPYAAPNSNPNPEVFRILEWKRFNITRAGKDEWALVVKVHYPDAKNFEGQKIMVYKDPNIDTLADLLRLTGSRLDPHFAEHGICPVARFPPTPKGWHHAIEFARNL
jgi:hypothetical protein